MQRILVDSNVILDVVELDPVWFPWSKDALSRYAQSANLVINQVVYAEVSAGFATIEELEEVLSRDDFEYAGLPWEAAFLSEKCFLEYRKQGGVKRSPLPDFFIGAHAAVEKMALLTRDPRRYRAYFPTVQLIAPDTTPP